MRALLGKGAGPAQGLELPQLGGGRHMALDLHVALSCGMREQRGAGGNQAEGG